MAWACHWAPILVAGALLAGTLAGIDRLGRASAQEGVVWLLHADVRALRDLPAGDDARILGWWLGGRLVQLHVDALRRTADWAPRRGLLLRLPLAALGWPGCG
jgi:hypothetical protein